MTYDEAIKYIHGVSNFFCKPGLERVKRLCSALGDPQRELRFIHVAGTNGKGSFCAMTDSVLRAAGYKVGLYTSPYILRFNERIRVNGESISDGDLARLTERVRSIAEQMEDKPTEFELITAIAFEHFRNERCDIVVLEVGMGGRLDATNVIDSPLLSAITGIALDHTAFLGDSVEKIALEKAGIIKKGVPVLYGGDDKSAYRVITSEADKKGSALYTSDKESLRIRSLDLSGSEFDYREHRGVRISLLGSYQPENAATVLDALDILREKGVKISEEAVRTGLDRTKWAARFEIIHRDPLVIFDGAHNPQGIAAAVRSIKQYFDKKVVIFTGVLKDKDYRQIAASISEVGLKAYTVTPENPRALSAEEYARVLAEYGVPSTPEGSVDEAIKAALFSAKEMGTALCCLGSLYTYEKVAEAIKKLDNSDF